MVHPRWPSVCSACLGRHRLLIFPDQGVVSGERHVEISNWFGPCESTFFKASTCAADSTVVFRWHSSQQSGSPFFIVCPLHAAACIIRRCASFTSPDSGASPLRCAAPPQPTPRCLSRVQRPPGGLHR